MVFRSDRYGLGNALNAYEAVYSGLSQQYVQEFGSLEAQSELANVCKGRWSRKSGEWKAGTTFSEWEKQSLCKEIQDNICKMESATKKTERLLEAFSKGANFLNGRPIPVFYMQPDVQKLDLWRDDLQGKLKTISILFEDIQRRSHLAKLEGEKLYQLVEPAKSSMFSSVWYALGCSSNVIDSKIAENSESDGFSSGDEGMEKYEHHIPPSSLKSDQILSDYRGGPDGEDHLSGSSEIDESTIDLRGRPVSSRRKTSEPIDSSVEGDLLKKSCSSGNANLFSQNIGLESERNFRKSPLQFDEENEEVGDEQVGTLEERAAENSALFIERRTPNTRRGSVDDGLLRKNSFHEDVKKEPAEMSAESFANSDESLVKKRTPRSERRSIEEILEECSLSDAEEETLQGEGDAVSFEERTVSDAIPIPALPGKNARKNARKRMKRRRNQSENV